MRNLKLCDHSINEVDVDVSSKLCIDGLSGAIYCVSTTGIKQLNLTENNGVKFCVSWPEEVNTSKIVSADVVTSSSQLCIVTVEGDVVTVHTETSEVEVVGSVCDGVTASCWSPDEELLVLVTGASNVVLMTAEFDIVSEFTLNQEDFGAHKFVNVGWGKKETQFHGTAGKQAAHMTKSNVQLLSQWDDLQPTVTWRGDGQLFAVIYVVNGNNCHRQIRIVNREGVVQSTSENVDGLEHCLSWKPSGNLIASSQRLQNKHQIIFFEKNGLTRGSFNLPFKYDEIIVKKLMWNEDSSVLSIWLRPTDTNCKINYIQLWTVGNYHWYLKQQLTFSEDILSVRWDSEHPLMLHLLTSHHIHQLNWLIKTDSSRGVDTSDLTQVAVIDGYNVNITPFRLAVVPPPMSAYTVSFPDIVNAILYAPSLVLKTESVLDKSLSIEDSGFLETFDPPGKNSNNLCVYHGDEMFSFLTQANYMESLSDFNCKVNITELGGKGFNVKSPVHRVLGQHKLKWDNLDSSKNIGYFSNLLWIKKDIIIASCCMESKTGIVVLELDNIGSDNGSVTVKCFVDVDEKVYNIISSADGSIVIIQFSSGILKQFQFNPYNIIPWKEYSNNMFNKTYFNDVALCTCRLYGDLMIDTIGLTSRNHLFWGEKQLSSNCTSFKISNDHLLYTTSSHRLEILRLTLRELKEATNNISQSEIKRGSRKIERGSRIVTDVAGSSSVLLQMPRGNLELITPRLLEIHILKRLLNKHQYKEAVERMRKQRIDMNLIYDHDPCAFLENILHFVMNVDDPSLIDLFLANLSEVDVTVEIYSDNYCDVPTIDDWCKPKNKGSKIDLVCSSVRDAMIEIDENKFLLPILTSHVKMTNSQMDIAIKKIEELKSKTDVKDGINAEVGLHHLLYIADANVLFDVALGTYDFDLVMMVFEKSQKDPKEYLPFLNGLRDMEENYRKFKIDKHLKRFEKALKNFSSCSDVHNEECLELISKENLYKEALDILKDNSLLYKEISDMYGEYLMNNRQYGEAALMFTRAGKLEKSFSAYNHSGNWKRMLILSVQMNFDKDKLNNLYYSLVDNLKSRCNYIDAAIIYENYLRSEEDAVENYISAGQWNDALRLAYKYNRMDLIETNLKPGIKEQCVTYSQDLNERTSTFLHYCERLVEVRDIFEKIHLDILDGKDDCNIDCDLYSDTSTVTGISHSHSSKSSTSGKSHRSSKSKRKLERKKYSTKEGSSCEDLGIVAALHELMVLTEQLITPISNFLPILLDFGMDEDAKTIQRNLSDLLILMQNKQQCIWPPEPVASDNNMVEFGPDVTTESMVQQMKHNNGVRPRDTNSIIILRMKQLEPHLRYPPQCFKNSNWQLSMLT